MLESSHRREIIRTPVAVGCLGIVLRPSAHPNPLCCSARHSYSTRLSTITTTRTSDHTTVTNAFATVCVSRCCLCLCHPARGSVPHSRLPPCHPAKFTINQLRAPHPLERRSMQQRQKQVRHMQQHGCCDCRHRIRQSSGLLALHSTSPSGAAETATKRQRLQGEAMGCSARTICEAAVRAR